MECDRSELKEEEIILAPSFRGSRFVLMGKKSMAVQTPPNTRQYECLVVARQQGPEGKEFRLELEFATNFKGPPLAPHFL